MGKIPLFGLILTAFISLYASPKSLVFTTKDGTIDTKAAHNAYVEGEFDSVLQSLESHLRLRSAQLSFEEKVFIYKHLGIIYASDPATRTKGESYLNQLLRLSPDIQLVDMYLSEGLERMFRDLKREFFERNAYTQQYDAYGRPLPKPEAKASNATSTEAALERRGSVPAQSPLPAKSPGPQGRSVKKWLWWSAGTLIVAGTVTAIVLLSEDPSDSPMTTD